jgi:uncharacterized membrane-anchored protein YitT (DUF2179 family)
VKRATLVALGSIFAAVGLEYFLIPNHLLDGGVTGISIIASYLTKLPLGLFLILFNLPFVYLGYKKLGKSFAALSAFGIMLLALLTSIVPDIAFTGQPILAATFGGIFVGIGVGLAIRYGGTLDGADTVAVLIDRVTVFSVGEAIMGINAVILTLSGFVFGWDNALYSIIAYFVVHKTVDVTVEGLNENRSVWIVSEHYREIGRAIKLATSHKVTYFKDNDVDDGKRRGIVLSVVTRFEEQTVKSIIQNIDPKAFIVVSNAHEIIGKNYADA